MSELGSPQRVLWSPEPPLGWPSCILSRDGGGKDGLGSYRYELRIPLGRGEGVCLFILANPSTAVVSGGVFQSDPTVTRCINFARSWGHGTAVVANVRAWRETDPKKVPDDPIAIGPENDAHLERLAHEARVVVCGWGKLGGARGPAVLALVRRAHKVPFALRLNGDGTPAHPLYLPANSCPLEIREGA